MHADENPNTYPQCVDYDFPDGEAATTYVVYLIYLYLEYYENMKIKLKCI